VLPSMVKNLAQKEEARSCDIGLSRPSGGGACGGASEMLVVPERYRATREPSTGRR